MAQIKILVKLKSFSTISTLGPKAGEYWDFASDNEDSGEIELFILIEATHPIFKNRLGSGYWEPKTAEFECQYEEGDPKYRYELTFEEESVETKTWTFSGKKYERRVFSKSDNIQISERVITTTNRDTTHIETTDLITDLGVITTTSGGTTHTIFKISNIKYCLIIFVSLLLIVVLMFFCWQRKKNTKKKQK